MPYNAQHVIDCGYFLGGYSEGLLYIPPKVDGKSDKSVIIPWSNLLGDEEESGKDVACGLVGSQS